MTALDGSVLTPRGFVTGRIRFSTDGRIAEVSGTPLEAVRARESKRPVVLPGFIDLHAHAGAMNATHGTTALLATTAAASLADLEHDLRGLAPLCERRPPGSARVLGAHLDFAGAFDPAELRRLEGIAPVRLITLAAEMPRHLEAIASLRAEGFLVQVGHGPGTYEQGVEALAAGARGFAHFLDAMTTVQHRTPGIVGAALAHAEFAEIVPDLRHLHPATIRILLRAIPRLYCVTAGTALTLDQALRNLVDDVGLALDEASMRVSTHAADYLGLADRGRLTREGWADVVVMDRDLVLQDVYVEGQGVADADRPPQLSKVTRRH